MADNKVIPAKTLEEIKAEWEVIIGTYGTLHEYFDDYEEMYFMSATDEMDASVWDQDDIKVTTSPAERNKVVGMQRLMKTSKLGFEAESDSKVDSNKVEEALKWWWKVSGEVQRASPLSDAALSAVLYGPIVMTVEFVDDLIDITKDKYDKQLYEHIRKRTPVIFRSVSARQCYFNWGPAGLRGMCREYETTVHDIRQKYGSDLLADKDPQDRHTIRDIYETEWRVVMLKEGELLFGKKHGMTRIPVAVSYTGGSSLFAEPEKQMQSFLYASNRGELHLRDNLLLTAFFTSIHARGTGPLVALGEDAIDENGEVVVNYAGQLRYIMGDVKLLDDKSYDKNLLDAMDRLKQLSEESTMYSQTLGQNLKGSQPFSSLALLSRTGQLPLNDPVESIELAVRDISQIALDVIRSEGIENSKIGAQEIPEDLELTARLRPKMPQDDLRNAQVASTIGDKVSDEWMHTHLLQIDDSTEMMKDIMKERAVKAVFQNLMQSPEVMQRIMSDIVVRTMGGQAGNNSTPPAPPGHHYMPDGSLMPGDQHQGSPMQGPPMPGQPPGQPNMESVPQTEPMPPGGPENVERV